MDNLEIIEIRTPDYEKVRHGEIGQELLVFFKVGDKKFKCKYIQEHYYYCGLPGTWRESCFFYRVEFGEERVIADCSGEFKIPHKPGSIEAYAHEPNYYGDDSRFLKADKSIVREYLIEPFINRYF